MNPLRRTVPHSAYLTPRPGILRCALLCTLFCAVPVAAETLDCVTTEWKLIGANHKVCVEAFADPQISGITCHVSQARTGGVKGSFGVAQDPSQFSLSCTQTGPIVLPEKLPKKATVFSKDTSLLFKETQVIRLWDAARQTLVYLAISRKLINGAPANSISSVALMPQGSPSGQANSR